MPTAPAPSAPSAPPDFLSPTGSLTPAAAGAVVFLIANTLGAVFGLPRAWTALLLSALIGALIVARFQASLPVRLGYWVVNSLTIFTVALGSNATLTGLTTPHTFAASSSGSFLASW